MPRMPKMLREAQQCDENDASRTCGRVAVPERISPEMVTTDALRCIEVQRTALCPWIAELPLRTLALLHYTSTQRTAKHLASIRSKQRKIDLLPRRASREHSTRLAVRADATRRRPKLALLASSSTSPASPTNLCAYVRVNKHVAIAPSSQAVSCAWTFE